MQEARIIDQIITFKNSCDLEKLIGRRYRLSPREVASLYLLQQQPVNSKALSAMIGVSPSRGSRIFNRLESRGFVQSRPDNDDRRNQIIGLSEYGEACIIELELEKDECEQRFLNALDPDQLSVVKQGMEILLQSL